MSNNKYTVTFGADVGSSPIDSSNFGGQVSTSGSNASKMKPKPKMVSGGTTTQEDDDPMGLIPTASTNPAKFKEVEIKSG